MMWSFLTGILGLFCLVFGLACLAGAIVCFAILAWMVWPVTLALLAISMPYLINGVRRMIVRRRDSETVAAIFRADAQRALVRDELTHQAILRGDADPWPQTGSALDP